MRTPSDRDAIAELYDELADELLRYLWRRCGDRAHAEDLLSVVFLEAWRRRAALRPGAPARPWVYGIATNVLRNHHRALRRHRAAVARIVAAAGPASAPGADEQAAVQRRLAEALGALRAVPRREQDVVALCAWAQLSYDEAATALGVPVGTVRSRLSRARRRLADVSAQPVTKEPHHEPA
jgi:RNA polymerase sigma-70 factor (ECF subfamily)